MNWFLPDVQKLVGERSHYNSLCNPHVKRITFQQTADEKVKTDGPYGNSYGVVYPAPKIN